MKRRNNLYMIIVMCLIITLGFAGAIFIGHCTYKKIIQDDIENISKLTSSNIFADIDSELTKPIFVAQTMASDSFLKRWLMEERKNPDDVKNSRILQEYLLTYKKKYGYDAVYMISSYSGIYYYFNGVNKKISHENTHDVWYYNFLASGQPYKLNIDSDEVNNNQLTVFVDCRVEDSDGRLLGVTGVGLKMSRLQEMLSKYEKNYGLSACLINRRGEITVDTDSRHMGRAGFFDSPHLLSLKGEVLNNLNEMVIKWYPEKEMDNCLTSRYIKNMDWFLVVQKNTEVIRDSFQDLLQKDLLIILLMLLLLLSISTALIRRYDRRMLRALNTDSLTGLPNRQYFHDMMGSSLDRKKWSRLFIFDIDRFKAVNDTKGHLFGNMVLTSVASAAQNALGENSFVARWGGDEFIGMIAASEDEALAMLERMQRKIKTDCEYSEIDVTVSIGLSVFDDDDKTLDAVMAEADAALYNSKKAGGDRITIYKKG